ncbi:unnamed protein product [Polarella glacialis]|uniref:RING-type domain-containing protein n=1 Tax=Polarella glacialis TaxID=89957 RepID=A0A813JJ38_POLGL|nr:unnamed protein product [Polarella glacialis]
MEVIIAVFGTALFSLLLLSLPRKLWSVLFRWNRIDPTLMARAIAADVDLAERRTATMTAATTTPTTAAPVDLAARAEAIFSELSVPGEPICVICLDLIAPKDPARQLSCSHAFHAQCISSWWRCRMGGRDVQVSCPTCKRDFDVCSRSALPQQQVNTRAAISPPQEEVYGPFPILFCV